MGKSVVWLAVMVITHISCLKGDQRLVKPHHHGNTMLVQKGFLDEGALRESDRAEIDHHQSLCHEILGTVEVQIYSDFQS